MTECIALIRGINVGRAKRIAMSDLRRLVSDLGHRNVRTLLNSGNVLFQCSRPDRLKLALTLQNAIVETHGFSAPVTVVTAQDLQLVVRENPLRHLAKDPARHLVGFFAQARSLEILRSLLKERWEPDALALGSRSAYLWCADGILDSRLLKTFAKHAGDQVTTRNWATVLKLLAASTGPLRAEAQE